MSLWCGAFFLGGCTRNQIWGARTLPHPVGTQDGRTGVQKVPCKTPSITGTPALFAPGEAQLAEFFEARHVVSFHERLELGLSQSAEFFIAEGGGVNTRTEAFVLSESSWIVQVILQADATVDGATAKGVQLWVAGAASPGAPFGAEVELRVNTLPAVEADTGRFNQGFYVTNVQLPAEAQVVRVRVQGLAPTLLKTIRVQGERSLPPPTQDPARDPELRLDGTTPGPLSAYHPPAFKSAPKGISIIPRFRWTNRPPKKTPTQTVWKHIVIHHSAMKMGSTGSDCDSNVRSILTGHMDGNGWDDVGYAFLICPDGRVYEGRAGGKNIRGAHALGVNENTVGVNLMGQFHTPAAGELGLNKPSEKALESAARLVAWLAQEMQVNLRDSAPLAAVRANVSVPRLTFHRFLAEGTPATDDSTACPGDLLIKELPGMRERALRYAENQQAAINTTGNAGNTAGSGAGGTGPVAEGPTPESGGGNVGEANDPQCVQ